MFLSCKFANIGARSKHKANSPYAAVLFTPCADSLGLVKVKEIKSFDI